MDARLAAGLAIGAALVFPAGAGATTYCVSKPSCAAAGGATMAGVQEALTAAQSQPGPDRVEIGPGSFKANPSFSYSGTGTNSVDIVGFGIDQTELLPPDTSGSGTSTLSLSGSPSSTVSDLIVRTRSGSGGGAENTGLNLTGTARRVHASASEGSAVRLQAGSTLLDSRVVGFSISAFVRAVAAGPGSTVERCEIDSSHTGVHLLSGSATVARSHITGAFGVFAEGSFLTVDNSIVHPTPHSTVFVGLTATGSASVVARHVTIDGRDKADGIGASAQTSGANQLSRVTVQSSVITRTPTALRRNAGSGGSAEVVARNSNYDPAKVSSGTGAGTIDQSAGNVNVAPGFLDGNAGDYRLRADSPMVDRGAAESPDGVPTADYAGAARAVEGDGDGKATPDIGAFEFVSQPPHAELTGPDSVEAGHSLAFSGGTSSDPDPGDALTNTWNTQGPGLAKLLRAAATATGPDLTQAFPAPGAATVALTVTDRAGRTDTATKTVTVVDTTLPGIAGFKTTNKAFAVGSKSTPLTIAKVKRGTKFQFALSEPSAVAIEIQRLIRGRLVGKKCRASARKGKRCKVYKRVGILRRPGALGPNSVAFSGRLDSKALAVGSYRALITATDASNNTSQAGKLSFRVVRAR